MAIRTDPERTTEFRSPDPPPARPLRRVWPFVVLALVLALALAWQYANPFRQERVDRTGPAVLMAIEDLSEYRAATGHFEVIVDLEEDSTYLPSFIRGERTLFVAAGSVDATVDFSGLREDAVEVSPNRQAVTLTLPSATLSDAVVDPEASHVFDRQRGLVDRLEGLFSDAPTTERDLYLLAEQRLQEAAAETELAATAERNTSLMLDGLLRSLGFTDVTVRFA
jgi:Protein of unknown function (DUF4230)